MRFTTTSLKSSKLILFAISLTVLTSCATYQSTTEDGIYASKKKKTRVIVADSDEYDAYEENYFTSQVARLDRINGTDIFTDIDSYSSLNDEDDLIIENDTLDYNPNSSWGEGSNTTVVVVNNGIGNYSDFWWDWRWNNWRWNRWNRWGYAGFYGRNWGWGFNNFGFYDPYFINNGYFNAFYCPPGFGFYNRFRGNGFFNNRYNRFNRRNGFLANNTRRYNTSRRNYVTNTRRSATSRRNSSTIRRNNTIRSRTRNNTIRNRTRGTSTRPRANTRTRTRSNSTRTRTRSSSTRSRTRSSSTRSRGSSTRRSSGRSRGRRG
ncbi:MAG: hypothetical protein JXQ93_08020 [Flavobacteriaceae bacterium]